MTERFPEADHLRAETYGDFLGTIGRAVGDDDHLGIPVNAVSFVQTRASVLFSLKTGMTTDTLGFGYGSFLPLCHVSSSLVPSI